MRRIGIVALFVLGAAATAGAQEPSQGSPAAQAEKIEPDRPDITHSPHLVPTGVVQVETGGIYNRSSNAAHDGQTPVSIRVGVNRWLEARADAQGFVAKTDEAGTVHGMGDVQLGAKIRLLADRDGAGLVALEPSVSVPVASQDKGLGTGQSDVIVRLLAGRDVLKKGHVDVNAGAGSLGAGEGLPRLAQYSASASASVEAGKVSPYVEVYGYSRESADKGRVVAVDAGVVVAATPRLAFDAGVQHGFTSDAPGLSIFAGVSVIAFKPAAIRAPQRVPRPPA